MKSAGGPEAAAGQKRSIRRVPVDRAAVPQRDPDVTSLVDGEPVRRHARIVDFNDRTAPADPAAVRIKVKCVDRRCRCRQVHDLAVGAPADPVRDRQSGQDGRASAVELEPVEHAGSGRFVIGHRPGPEPTLWITGSVVHPHVGAAGLRLGELADLAGLVGEQEADARCDYVSPADRRRDSTDRPVELDRGDQFQARPSSRPRCSRDPRCRPTTARRAPRPNAAPR